MGRLPSAIPDQGRRWPSTALRPDLTALEAEVLAWWAQAGVPAAAARAERAKTDPFGDGRTLHAQVLEEPLPSHLPANLRDLSAPIYSDVVARAYRMDGYHVPTARLFAGGGPRVEARMRAVMRLPDDKAIIRHGAADFIDRCRQEAGTSLAAWYKVLDQAGIWTDAAASRPVHGPEHEALVLATFAALEAQGLIKPTDQEIEWCSGCKRALVPFEPEARPDQAEADADESSCPDCGSPVSWRRFAVLALDVATIGPKVIELARVRCYWVDGRLAQAVLASVDKDSPPWPVERPGWHGIAVPLWRCDRTRCGRTLAPVGLDGIGAAFGTRPAAARRDLLDPLTRPCTCGQGTLRREGGVLAPWLVEACRALAPEVPEVGCATTSFPFAVLVAAGSRVEPVALGPCLLVAALHQDPAALRVAMAPEPEEPEIDPWVGDQPGEVEAVELARLGADLARLALLLAPKERPEQVAQGLLGRLWALLHFFCVTAEAEGFEAPGPGAAVLPIAIEDRYLLAALSRGVAAMHEALFRTELAAAATHLVGLVDLFAWYLSAARGRFFGAGPGKTAEAAAALAVLWKALAVLARAAAPLLPFYAEVLHQSLGSAGSVHLEAWPDLGDLPRDPAIEARLDAERAAAGR